MIPFFNSEGDLFETCEESEFSLLLSPSPLPHLPFPLASVGAQPLFAFAECGGEVFSEVDTLEEGGGEGEVMKENEVCMAIVEAADASVAAGLYHIFGLHPSGEAGLDSADATENRGAILFIDPVHRA